MISRGTLATVATLAAGIMLAAIVDALGKAIEARRFDRFRAASDRPSVVPDPEETIDA